jgi:ribonucleoside-diphosphate reductase alpha chain
MEAGEWDGVNGLETVPDEFGDVFVTTEQISAEDHALMQRRLQEHVDSGISKTINLPEEATRNDVDDAYRLALSRDDPGVPAKGVTVYRDNSRDEQVKSTTADMDEAGSSNGIEGDSAPDPIELYQSDEWSDEDVKEFMDALNVDVDEDEEELDQKDFSIGFRDHHHGEDVEYEGDPNNDSELCPECGEVALEIGEGCELCPECGYSPCS